jgi:hypothetical protein
MTGEGKVVPVHATKAFVGVEEYLHSFLNLDLYRDEWSISGSCHFSTGGKRPRHPLYIKLDGPQKWSRCSGEDKNLLLRPGIELRFLGYPVRSLITITDYAVRFPTSWQ